MKVLQNQGNFTVIVSTINSSLHQNILEENVSSTIQQLKLGWNLVLQQGSDAKHIKVLHWPTQSPGLDLIEKQDCQMESDNLQLLQLNVVMQTSEW